MDSVYAIGRRIIRGTMPRLVKPTKDNIGGVVLALIGIFYIAYLHGWSRQTLLSNIWEGVAAMHAGSMSTVDRTSGSVCQRCLSEGASALC